jgi:uncharacterized membrane protein YedE/YeeE
MILVASLASGLIFGWGLLISGMVQPAKVLGFLDIFGAWDPSLAVVMIAALVVSVPGLMLAKQRGRPMFAQQTVWPTRMAIDLPLVVGSTLFGIGWGLVGLCPGPALENIVTLSPRVIAFVVALIAGMELHDLLSKSRPDSRAETSLATAADG